MSAGLNDRRSFVVARPATAARLGVATALRDAGCQLTAELTTRLQARRGSQLAGSVAQDRLPVAVLVTFAEIPDGTQVTVEITDRWRSPVGNVFGMDTAFRRVFADLMAAVEAGATGGVPPAPRTVGNEVALTAPERPSPAAVLDRANASVGGLARRAMKFADRTLQGRPAAATPQDWAAVQRLELAFGDWSDGAAIIALADDEAEAVLAVAAIISAQPEEMPPPLIAHLERLAQLIEPAMSSGQSVPRVPLQEPDRPAVEFLRQQAALRESLPVRRLMICRTCKFEKIVNDDYQRLLDRNRRLQALAGGFGASIRGGQVNPFIVFGQLLRAKKLDPDFVCPRCQGLHADPYVVVFCPRCGRRHRSGGLRQCACGHDFRAQGAALLAQRRPAAPAPGESDPPG
jgi:hypothetical protein